MANKVFNLKLDLNGRTIIPRIEIRRNDFDTNVFNAQILQDGVPVDLTGLTPLFECVTPAGYYVRDGAVIMDAPNGKVTYTLQKEVFAALGAIKNAYFVFEQIVNNEVKRLSTPDIPFSVIKDATTCNTESAAYVNDLINKIVYLNTGRSESAIFGAYWDKSASPIMTRTDDAEGMTAAVGTSGQLVKNDFDHVPIWGEIDEVKDSYGNAFVKIPKFYIHRKNGTDFLHEQVSKTEHPGFYLPWCFWDFANNKELDYVLVGKHEAALSSDGKLESKPGKFPLVQKNIVDFRNYARANNVGGLKGYQQYDVHAHDVLATLFHIEFATLNSQAVMKGWTVGRRDANDKITVAETQTNRAIIAADRAANYLVGQPIGIGDGTNDFHVFYGRTITAIEDYDASNKALVFDGDPVDLEVGKVVYNCAWKTGFSRDILATSGSIINNTSGKFPCAYRGIENPFGSLWKFVDGLNINNGQTWVAKNADDYASNVFANPYEPIGYENAHDNGWVKDMGFDPDHPYAQLPTALGGGDSSYYSDYYYQNASGQFIARVGAAWRNGSYAGLSIFSLDSAAGWTAVNDGGRLLKKAL
ncbi:BppU family phage baseplate upper protein [Sporolactobacillus terrae]|uniref:BppU family phage baseplate upper protein n=1 Tax=Sporolactobacillus terrae TaxID=269673 RepID=UPI00048F6CAF|nr:BppU family phage baseplate upper protein [Sporolactobacillus terrae]